MVRIPPDILVPCAPASKTTPDLGEDIRRKILGHTVKDRTRWLAKKLEPMVGKLVNMELTAKTYFARVKNEERLRLHQLFLGPGIECVMLSKVHLNGPDSVQVYLLHPEHGRLVIHYKGDFPISLAEETP